MAIELKEKRRNKTKQKTKKPHNNNNKMKRKKTEGLRGLAYLHLTHGVTFVLSNCAPP